MKRKTILLCIFLFGNALAVVSTAAQSTNAEFQQAVKAYQQSRSSADAEKVIKLALTLDPKPAIPEEARRHYVKACTLFEDAKQTSESADAAGEFRQALLLAPWWGEAYMKMGLALETAQRYDEAIASLKLFIATKPQDDLLRKTQDEIYKIEAKQEKAAKEAELAARKAKDAAMEPTASVTKEGNGPRFEGHWYLIAPQDGSRMNDYIVISRKDNGELVADRSANVGEVSVLRTEKRRIIMHSEDGAAKIYDFDLSLSADESKLAGKFKRTFRNARDEWEAPETFPMTLHRQQVAMLKH
jgi:hypothetical protein